jgi:hypothetical protein
MVETVGMPTTAIDSFGSAGGDRCSFTNSPVSGAVDPRPPAPAEERDTDA